MMGGREVVIVEAVRSAVGRGHPEKGVYRDVHANVLLGTVLAELVRRAGIDPHQVDDVITGCVTQYGEQSLNIGRNAWLQAGLPYQVPATTLDRQCGSSQQALNFAAAQVAAGVHDVVIAAGVEHMGHLPIDTQERWQDGLGTAWPQELLDRYAFVPLGIAGEELARAYDVSREAMDELAARSHRLAAAATAEGLFAREIAPVAGVTADQGIRPATTTASLGALKPAFREGGSVTAGNASQISDGAAALLLTTREKAAELGLRPRARVLDQAVVGVDPVLMLEGPIPVTRKLLGRLGLGIGDIDRYEINEAFASVPIAWERELGADRERMNVNGGAIALGHPLGASGARLLTTLLHELERSNTELGLVAMCCRGGIGTGTVIQRV